MNPIAAYNGKAADYATHRLPYSREAIGAILQVTGMDSTCTMADIAAGTGMVSKMFIGHVARIFAVEPNEEMREQAKRLLDAHATFECIAATAERTTLPATSVDLITVGQAWHWFDPEAAAREFVRILRPTGWVAIIWNHFGNEKDPDMTPLFTPGEAKHMAFPMTVEESWDQYIGGTRSAAAAPSVSDPAYRKFEADQRLIFDSGTVNDMFTVEYQTKIVVGKVNLSKPVISQEMTTAS